MFALSHYLKYSIDKILTVSMKYLSFLLIISCFAIQVNGTPPKRIITLSSAITTTVDALGLGKNIVAVDVTSSFPSHVKKLPKVSKNRSVSAESLISFAPDLIIGLEGEISRETVSQLKSSGIKLVLLKQEYSAKGATDFIKSVASAVGLTERGNLLAAQTTEKINHAIATVKKNPKNTRVLFLYARGTGVMMVSGKNTHIDAIINLSGGRNAVQGFNDFKPFSTEGLIQANPDVILMFDFGFSSLGGINGILKIPGMKTTNAGKNKRIVQMDGELLTNFATRLDQAILQLNALL